MSARRVRPSVLFIDDDQQFRQRVSRELSHLGVTVSHCHPEELEVVLRSERRASQFDLFLVDYRLDMKAGKSQKKFPWKGSAIAGMVRGRLPEHPIYMVSRLVDAKTRQPGWEYFDRTLSVPELLDSERRIISFDAHDYSEIRRAPRGSLKTLLMLLAAPGPAKESLTRCLPAALQAGIQRKGDWAKAGPGGVYDRVGAGLFGWWVRTVLLEEPGPLLSDLRSATHLGLSLPFFQGGALGQLALGSAQYKGVFARTGARRWWAAELERILFSRQLAQHTEPLRPWELGPVVFDVPAKGRSKCFVCKLDKPETVGVDADDPDVERPVHIRCSELAGSHSASAFFEPVRQFRTT